MSEVTHDTPRVSICHQTKTHHEPVQIFSDLFDAGVELLLCGACGWQPEGAVTRAKTTLVKG